MKTSRKNNCLLILAYLKKHGTITADQCRNRLNIRRLAARIYDLRAMGANIESHMHYSNNDRFAVYVLNAGRS